MEELNKNQIVLLTLLVSFVTSIATGIVTVTLMDQAPTAVTQTINRVVERTIEKAVPGETKVTTVVKEVPVVVTEDKLIVDVINNTSSGAVRIANVDGKTTLGTGFIVNKNGLIATAELLLIPPTPEAVEGAPAPSTPAIPTDYQVFFNNSKSLPAKLVKTSVEVGVALLKVDLGDLADVTKITGETGASFKELVTLKLAESKPLPGQTVVALGLPDEGPINVSGGLVSSVYADSASVTLIKTTAANISNLGGPLFNTAGEVIGLNRAVGTAIGAEMIRQAIAGIGN